MLQRTVTTFKGIRVCLVCGLLPCGGVSTQPANGLSTKDYYRNENSRREDEHIFASSTDLKNTSGIPSLIGPKRDKVTRE